MGGKIEIFIFEFLIFVSLIENSYIGLKFGFW
nr:MAG TPA: hypothetical protein [Caudoviricetes sp.]